MERVVEGRGAVAVGGIAGKAVAAVAYTVMAGGAVKGDSAVLTETDRAVAVGAGAVQKPGKLRKEGRQPGGL